MRGSIIGILSQLINLAAKFVVRTFFIRYLGSDLLGLDSVLMDIIRMLSLAEMGITSSMLFRLYPPMLQKDHGRINALMAAYRKIYHGIALVIFLAGMVFSLALPKIVKGLSLSWGKIYLAFSLQLACSVSSYLLAYQRILLHGDQKKHICLTVDLAANLAFSVLSILCIIAARSYEAYLAASILQTISADLILRSFTRRHYPFVNRSGTAQASDRREILSDTKDLLGNKLAGYVYNSTDNLIVSCFLGTGTVGLLSNYKYISSALRSLMNSTMSTIQPLLGSYLNAGTKPEESFATLKRYTFIRFFLAGMAVLPFVTLSHVFIGLWSGSADYVLGLEVPLLIAADFYIGCVYYPLREYILGLGLFKKGKYASYACALCNALLSLIGVQLWGIQGVLLATVIAQLVIWLGDGIIILRGYYGGNRDHLREYVTAHLGYAGVLVFCCSLSSVCLRSLALLPDPAELLLGAAMDELLFFCTVVIVFRNRDEFQYAVSLIKTLFRKVLQKNEIPDP